MVATAGIAAATWIISSCSPVGANVNPKSVIPCSTSTGSSVFVQLTGISGMPNKHTHTHRDHATAHEVCSNSPHFTL